ncbi:hypothetical protein D0869_09691 [Hortaea werneckii]|uniref:Uncharacterized protein n=2 Tax=Hortaea werneckii TaxID=91943 RepID=A0A3M6WGX0_HORWE|nr:hypothetical protein D0869_09691 [Hortaea werneckii]
MASSDSSSEEPSEYSGKECYGPLTLRNPASGESSSVESSEHSIKERNRPSTSHTVASISEDLSEHSAQEHNAPSTRQTVAPSDSSSEELSEHSTCSEGEQEAVMRDWRLAESFQELLDLNRKFMRGESKRSCYHSAPIFDETVALPTWHSATTDLNKMPLLFRRKTQQRPFLMFIIPFHGKVPEEVIRRFLVELLIDDDFYAHIWRDEGSCRWEKCRKNIRTASSFPQDWATHTRKEAEKEEDLASAELRHQQLLDVQCGCETTIFATYDNVMEDASPLLVRVLAKGWEETNLQALVEDAAIRAGVQPLYAEAADE